MYSFPGRGSAPRKSTPANVQCQKCLKRDKSDHLCIHSHLKMLADLPKRHYSYECKAAPQERPYVPRPSRTQQLLNPKLRPDLTNATLDPVQQKSGVADAELAKRAAERARLLKAMEQDSDDDVDDDAPAERQQDRSSPEPRRQMSRSRSRSRSLSALRSRTYDSASSRSRSSVGSRSRQASLTPDRRVAQAPPSRGRDAPGGRPSRQRYSSSERSRSASPASSGRGRRDFTPRRGELSPSAHMVRDSTRRSPSLSPERIAPSQSRQFARPLRDRRDDRDDYGGRGRSRSPEERQRRCASPSFERPVGREGRNRGEAIGHRYRDRRDPQSEEPPRPRSLSPFSKRMALTRAMNTGR